MEENSRAPACLSRVVSRTFGSAVGEGNLPVELGLAGEFDFQNTTPETSLGLD